MEFEKSLWGNEWNESVNIKFTDQPYEDEDVYYTDKEDHIIYNCKSFGIDLSEFADSPSFIDVHRFNYYFVITSKLDLKYTMTIVSSILETKFLKEVTDKLPVGVTEKIFKAAELPYPTTGSY